MIRKPESVFLWLEDNDMAETRGGGMKEEERRLTAHRHTIIHILHKKNYDSSVIHTLAKRGKKTLCGVKPIQISVYFEIKN